MFGGLFGGGGNQQQQQPSYGPTNIKATESSGQPKQMEQPAPQQPQQPPSNQNDNVGHEGTYNGMNRQQYRDAWMSSGVKDQAGLTNFLQQHGGMQLSGNGTVRTPYGDDAIDMLIGARSGGNGMPGWTGVGQAGANSTPWNPATDPHNQQQQGGGGGNPWMQNFQNQFQTGGYSGNPQPRRQDMPYNTGINGGANGPISNYFQGGGQFGQQPFQQPPPGYDMGQNNQATDQGPYAWGGQNNQGMNTFNWNTPPQQGYMGGNPNMATSGGTGVIDPNQIRNTLNQSGWGQQNIMKGGPGGGAGFGHNLIQQMMKQYGGPPPGYQGPQAGDMVSNGWGGMKRYDPNDQSVN